jgi:hypothetical protein
VGKEDVDAYEAIGRGKTTRFNTEASRITREKRCSEVSIGAKRVKGDGEEEEEEGRGEEGGEGVTSPR